MEYQGILGLIQMLPWHKKSILIIKYPRFRRCIIPRAPKDCNLWGRGGVTPSYLIELTIYMQPLLHRLLLRNNLIAAGRDML